LSESYSLHMVVRSNLSNKLTLRTYDVKVNKPYGDREFKGWPLAIPSLRLLMLFTQRIPLRPELQ